METIIIVAVSVLSTLGIVALVTAIVVMFKKLKNKVDGVELDHYKRDIDERFNNLETMISNEVSAISRRIDETEGILTRSDDEIRKQIDSRCDKLHSMFIQNQPTITTSTLDLTKVSSDDPFYRPENRSYTTMDTKSVASGSQTSIKI
jgi:hypothetical protein